MTLGKGISAFLAMQETRQKAQSKAKYHKYRYEKGRTKFKNKPNTKYFVSKIGKNNHLAAIITFDCVSISFPFTRFENTISFCTYFALVHFRHKSHRLEYLHNVALCIWLFEPPVWSAECISKAILRFCPKQQIGYIFGNNPIF